MIGTTSVEISELLGKMLTMRKVPHNVLNAKLHKKEADIVAEAGKPGQVTIATNMAGRGTDIKLLDDVKKQVVWQLLVQNDTIHDELTDSYEVVQVDKVMLEVPSFMCL